MRRYCENDIRAFGVEVNSLTIKTLTVVVVVQTAVLLLLFVKVAAIDARMMAADDFTGRAPVPGLIETRPDTGFSNERQSASVASFPNEQQLRQIIRDELIAHIDVQKTGNDRTGPAAIRDEITEIEYQYRREQVGERINYFSSVGRISGAEMEKLQSEIATLDNAGRREMLGKLIRALNSGELEGNL